MKTELSPGVIRRRDRINRWFSSLLAALAIAGLAGANQRTTRGADFRTWSDATGTFKKEASFQRLDGDTVLLKTADGRNLAIPLERLCESDRAYAKQAASVPTADDPFRVVGPDVPAPASESPPTVDVRVVVAKGVGATVEDAKKDAYREAVRQVVGAYVEGDTLTRNDELIEDKILSLSGALVQKADVLADTVTTADGLVKLRIRAEVKVTEVMNSLARINVTTTAVRSTDIQGQVVTRAAQTDAAELALGDATSWAKVPASFFVMKLVGQPNVLKARGDDATVQVLLQLAPDRAQYMAFAKRLIAVLSKLEGPKGTFTIDGRKPGVEQHGMKEAQEELWRHTLIASFNRGNGSEPEISYAFPKTDREALQAYFEGMKTELPAESQCLVYCFNQNVGRQPHGCGLKAAAEEWKAAIGRKEDGRLVVCLMTQANESFNRTKWDWFACDRSLFPAGQDSPWLRCIECEITLYDKAGAEIATDIIPLTEGFGVSCRDLRYGLPVVMLAPTWVDVGDSSWPSARYAYVPQFTFPRWLELTAKEAASIAEVKCVVRPRVNKSE